LKFTNKGGSITVEFSILEYQTAPNQQKKAILKKSRQNMQDIMKLIDLNNINESVEIIRPFIESGDLNDSDERYINF
jgi:hypothetical protein